MSKVHRAAVLVVGAFTFAARAEVPAGRSPPTHGYSLEDAVVTALANHPRIAAARHEEEASAGRVDEANTSALPQVGVSAELNRSTGNTSPGAFFSAAGFVPIAGAPRGKTFDGGTWQTGVAAWASWDVLSFSRAAAAVDVALAGKKESEAATNAERLEIAYRAADTFLLTLEAEETVRAATANVERARVLVTMTKPLVDQSLRPGADLTRAEAELAGAEIQLARSEQMREVRRAALAEAIGHAGDRIDTTPGRLLEPAPTLDGRARPAVTDHPRVAQAAATAARAGEALRLVDLQYLPRVDVVAALWVRGSGFFGSPAAGVGPDIPNWAAGVVATWSILDIPAIRARARIAAATHSAALARRDEAMLAVSGQLATAAAVLEGAVRVARQTPAALASAETAELQVAARYKTGLSPVVDVADAERVLAQAAIDDAVARLEVRRALLLFARASGDLRPFLAETRDGGT